MTGSVPRARRTARTATAGTATARGRRGAAEGAQSRGAATPAGQDNAQCTQSVKVKPNSTYTLSAWVQ
ncbi:chitinase, partial [Streptomyces sp. NPDC048489]